MGPVELAGLGKRQVDALLRDDAQASILELGIDLAAGQGGGGSRQADDGKRCSMGHGFDTFAAGGGDLVSE